MFNYARAMSLIHPFVDIYFLKKDREISKEAERIYMAFALSRKNNENVNFIDIFKNSERLTLSSYERFEVVKRDGSCF